MGEIELAEQARLEAEQRAALRRAIAESEPVRVVDPIASSVELRGIPVAARGVGGVVPGTHPEQEAMRKDAKRRARAAWEEAERIAKQNAPIEWKPTDPPFFREVYERIDRHIDEERLGRWIERQRKLDRRRNAKRRARMKGVRYETVDRETIIRRDDSTCYLCGKKCEASEIHLDHIVPLALGGSHTADNLGVACAECNMWKGATLTELRPAALGGTVCRG